MLAEYFFVFLAGTFLMIIVAVAFLDHADSGGKAQCEAQAGVPECVRVWVPK